MNMAEQAPWVDGFNRAIVDYLVRSDHPTSGSGWSTKIHFDQLKPISQHVVDCGVGEIFAVDEELSQVSVFDTFDSDASAASCTLSASFSCKCGEHPRIYLSMESTIADAIRSVTHPRD
jgi:hypothetical protein